MKLLSLLDRFVREFPGHFIATVLTLAILSVGGAMAATSYDTVNGPQMNLDVSIVAGQTTGIRIATPQINGGDWVFSSTTGGVLRIRSGFIREDIYYSEATVNDDLTVTLTGSVIRHLCENVPRDFVSCGDGYGFSRGAIVEVNQDARLFNLKANLDRENVFTASGAVRFSGSGSLQMPYYATTADRDLQRPSPQPFEQACVTATGLCYAYIGGSWIAYGNTGVGNATEAATGIVELASVADQLARTASDNGPLILQARHLTSSGGALANGRIFIASGSTLDESALGVGTASGKYLRSYIGNPTWTDVVKSVSLVNSGSLTTNSFMTGAMLDVKHTDTSYFTVEAGWKNGHIKTGGSAPTFAPECTMSASAGNDSVGAFTVSGAEERCSMYFNKAYTTAPSCVISVNNLTTTSTTRVISTTSGMIVTELGDDTLGTIKYICLGY